MDGGRLRIRWSQREQQWAVERKIARKINYISRLDQYKKLYTSPTDYITVENDSWVRAREGLICIGYVKPRPQPNQWLINNLEHYRLERWGGVEGAAQKMEAAAETAQTRKLRADRQRWQDISEDVWESFMWEGHRVAVPSNYKA
jgi:hypothetical protein